MIFTRLTVENFGLFAGRHDFYLRPYDSAKDGADRPIVLIGGMNGAGKTTFFEAIRLCLYGQLALGNRVRVADYETHLRQRIHRASGPDDEAPCRAATELEFEHTHNGEVQTYRVRREWAHTETGVDESMSLWRNNSLVTDLDPSQWQDFVKELIPPGIAQLFFFDGERIQALAEDESNTHLTESIKSLLGLDLVDRLDSDLAIYLQKQQNKQRDSSTHDLEDLENQISYKEQEIHAYRQDRAQLEAKIDHLEAKIEEQEQRITSEGGQYASQRNELKERRTTLDSEITQLEDQLRNLAEGLLPFALVPELCQQLRQQLENESQLARWQASLDYLSEHQEVLWEELTSDGLLYLTDVDSGDELKEEIQERLERAFQKISHPPSGLQHVEPIHNLSPEENQLAISWCDEALGGVPEQLLQLTNALENRVRERQEIEHRLNRAPSDDALQPLLDELSRMHGSFFQLQEEADNVDGSLQQLVNELDDLQRQRQRLKDQISQMAEDEETVRKASQVRKVLESYSQRLTASKIQELAQNATDCFRKLCRKQDWIDHLTIDPDDFAVTLYDRHHHAIPKSRLSAGEKQIYAVAMLWALGITSGRPLPVMIDTPLGRLDSSHRKQLVDNYFPYASHQIILLSTDTEVDRSFFEDLEPHIASVYRLEYDPEAECTEVSEGYFWSLTEDEEAPAHAAQ